MVDVHSEEQTPDTIKRYEGVIEEINDDETFTARFVSLDDNAEYPEELYAEFNKSIIPEKDLQVGVIFTIEYRVTVRRLPPLTEEEVNEIKRKVEIQAKELGFLAD